MYQHRPYGWLYRHEPCSYRLIVCRRDTMLGRLAHFYLTKLGHELL